MSGTPVSVAKGFDFEICEKRLPGNQGKKGEET
jgi:hypothetical protein